MQPLELIRTSDGSNTLFNAQIGAHYHSKNGAIQESKHVFVAAGLTKAVEIFPNDTLSIFEIGFGTGLNYLMSRHYAYENQFSFQYTGIELSPIATETLSTMGYHHFVDKAVWETYLNEYRDFMELNKVTDNFTLICNDFLTFETDRKYHLLYFDAFSVQEQAEMWTEESIHKAADLLLIGGVFVTYAITGHLKRTLKSRGFSIEKLPGAAGKREMLRAQKEI